MRSASHSQHELGAGCARPLNFGHRGAESDAPENTLAAFELAIEQGADGVEFDVRFSRDGVPVVIHDARLDRTTSGVGRVDRFTAAAIRRLDVGSWFNRRFPDQSRERYAGLKVPLLAEVMAWVRERRCLALVEIKRPRLTERRAEARILDVIHRARAADQSTIISFHLPSLRRLRQLDPAIALGLDFTRPLLAMRRAQSVGAATLLPHWALASRRFIERAHVAGLRVLVWDLDDPRWMRQKIEAGVDGIITGRPAALAAILRERERSGRQTEAARQHP
jgi:glycerophosphoryl diester phosphodiesterase